MTAAAHLDLHTEVTGTGPTVVLLPPVGLGAWVWRPVATRLAVRRTVVAVDLPGFGSPSLPAGTPWTVDRFTDAVAAFLAARCPEAIEVAGVSLGGAIALELARRSAVRHAVAVSPIGFWSRGESRYAVASLRVTQRVARMSRPVRWRLACSPTARALLLAQTVGRPRNVPAGAVAAMARDVAGAPFVATLPHTGRYHFAPCAGIDRRITVAWGSRDRLLSPRRASAVLRRSPPAGRPRPRPWRPVNPARRGCHPGSGLAAGSGRRPVRSLPARHPRPRRGPRGRRQTWPATRIARPGNVTPSSPMCSAASCAAV